MRGIKVFKNRAVKKITRKFSDFIEEEQWLQSMLKDGWILKSYDLEDDDDYQYVFEPINNEAQKNLMYRIDFREFRKTEEFVKYKVTFEDAKWTLLSRNKYYSKHIFFSERTNSYHREIFSKQSSYTKRKQRKMSSCLLAALISFSVFFMSVVLYIIFDKTSIIGASLFLLILTMKFITDYIKHRTVYRQDMGTVRTFY